MLLIQKLKRPTSVVCILLIVFNVTFPTISWALTSGPTAPEATSFEPVDTTDMVNLSSGDLAYNLPLLEVPGPAGSYPLSLSYHAGIQPNEDASWVGLGWTLNPGSVIRNVNGFADDLKDVTEVSRYYWEGGETKTYSVGVTVGQYGSPASFSFGLSYSQDTFQGTGIGINAGLMLGPFSANGSFDGYGNANASAGLSIGKNIPLGQAQNYAIGANHTVGVSTNLSSSSTYSSTNIGLSLVDRNKENETKNHSLLGATISSSNGNTNTSFGIAGGSKFGTNSKMGKVSTSSSGFTIPIPTGVLTFSLGYNVQRYWIDETENTITNGLLYFPASGSIDKNFLNDHAFDTYSLKDPNDRDNFINDPERSLGGTLPGYDNYYAHAQGVNGNFRPYLFQKYLFRKNKYQVNSDNDTTYQTINYSLGNDPKPVEFRFVNNFSNRYEYEPAEISQSTSITNPLSFDFLGNPVTGKNGSEAYLQNNLPGSQNIIWLTNSEILNPSSTKRLQSGYMESVATGFDRSSLNGDLIGGYVITNESGVKYHFGLPAMSKQEYFYSENNDDVLTFNEFKKDTPYAYTWYLTGVTGPDYVDRGPSGSADGIMNEYDWGYWVQFEYGKWTDQYAWRNPGEGMDKDLDTKFENFSEGVKELYYLDAIRTATHTALFIKDIRNDGKSSLRFLRNKFFDREYLNSLSKLGGYLPTEASCSCAEVSVESIDYVARPTSTLRLRKILLLDNREVADYNINKAKGDELGFSYTYNWTGPDVCDAPPINSNPHLYQNVLDIYDEAYYFSGLKDKALRIIDLETDYSLSPETLNSYDSDLVKSPNPSNDPADYPLTGKLTLTKLKFLGKGGADFVPPLKFNYELENPISGSASLTQEPGSTNFSFVLANSDFKKGDLITALNFYAVVTNIDLQGRHFIRIIGQNQPSTGINYSWHTTKNPPYNKDFYDIWGAYKSDYTPIYNNENISRIPSYVSSRGVDAWSLRSVETSLGSTMILDYESDSYDESIFYKNYSIPLTFEKIQDPDYPDPGHEIPNPIMTLKGFIPNNTEINLNQIYSLEEEVPVIALYGNCTTMTGGSTNCGYSTASTGTVMEVSQNFIRLRTDVPYIENYDQNGVFHSYPYYGGQMYFGSSVLNYGGGIRVKSVGIESNLDEKGNYTIYEYSNGVTSYEPVKNDQYDIGITDENALAEYAFQINQPISKLVALGNFIPPPGVLYKNVTVKEIVKVDGTERLVPNYSEYEFETFTEDMVQIYRQATSPTVFATKNYGGYVDYDRTQVRDITIKDFSTRLGSLKRIAFYADDGNGNSIKLSETINHYLFDDPENFEANLATYGNQGVIEETFAEAIFARRYHLVFGEQEEFALHGMITKKEEYPSIQTGQTNINYKTGITTTSTNLGFDYYSGQVVQTLSTDGYGNAYVTETIPAYTKYPEMGQGAFNGGKNMLTQAAGTVTYKVDPANSSTPIGLVSASAQTWSKDVLVLGPGSQSSWKIYRMGDSYSWKGDNASLSPDGLYPTQNFSEFDGWVSTPTSNQWQRNGSVTLYDVFSHALEASDINGNFAATKMSSDQVKIFASVANAQYSEFAYSGAEDTAVNGFYGGEVAQNSGIEVTQTTPDDKTTTHTGRKALQLSASGQKAFEFTGLGKANRIYRASVWTSHPDGKIKYSLNGVAGTETGNAYNGGIVASNKKAGDWYLVNLDIPIGPSNSTLKVWCETSGAVCRFDDFRVHPIDGPITSYVYNEWGELSHILDNNNLYTEYKYDEMGRLTTTFKETLHQNNFFGPDYGSNGIVKVSEIEYNYGANYVEGSDREGLDVVLTEATAGNNKNFTAHIDFGYPPFNFRWFKDNVLVQEETVEAYQSIYTNTTNNGCPYDVRLEVTDDRASTRTLNATGGTDNLVLGWGFDDPIQYNSTTYSVTISSGSCGPYTYHWRISSNGGATTVVEATTPTITHTFNACGTYSVSCKVSGPHAGVYKQAIGTVRVDGTGCGPIH